MGSRPDYSEAVAADIDAEIRALIEAAHDEAWEILVEYRPVLDNLVLELMEKETLSRAQVLEVFSPVVVKAHRPSYAGYGKRLPSDRPPILTPKEQSANGSLTPGHQDALPSGDGA
jgi:cell division protease FtsH